MSNTNTGNAHAVADSQLNKPVAERSVAAGIAQPVVQAKVQTKLDIVMVSLDDFFKAYAEKMKPGVQLSTEEGAGMQIKLWRALQGVLKLQGTDFAPAYAKFLAWVKDNRKTFFSEKYAFRFYGLLTGLSSKDRICFERLMALILNTCDPATRQQVINRYDTNYVYRAFDNYMADVPEKLREFYAV